MYHGQGTCQFKDGHTYKGEVRYGLLNGKGTFFWTDGTKYKGEFRENEITGKGQYTWADGSTYEGEVLNGLRHGFGVYKNEKEGAIYKGKWENGMRHGQGELRYHNGSYYVGNWERGMKWGSGKMVYASGNYYEGNWENNKRNGHGEMHWESSHEKYSGNWLDNFQSGFGTHIWFDQAADNKLLRNRYVGYWLKGLRHGKGTFYYSNGSKYEGDWAENFKHGHGIFTFEDGTEYDGPFEKDRMINRKIEVSTVFEPAKQPQAQPAVANSSPPPAKQNIAKDANTTKMSFASKTGAESLGHSNAHGNTNMGATNMGATTNSMMKTYTGPKEVEQNPFKKLIDITDLLDNELNPTEVEKECQNILLRHNSELKQWYQHYSKKVEVTQRDESFSMTMRQVWRFLRDCQVTSPDATIAQFNRIYNQGRKNHFTLLLNDEMSKFDYLYNSH